MKRLLISVVSVVLLATACTSDEEPASTTVPPTTADQTTTTPETTTTESSSSSTTTLPAVVVPEAEKVSFGQLASVPLLQDGTAYAGPATPGSLGGVIVADWIDDYLDSNAAKDQLAANGFVVVPGTMRHFHHIYEGAEYGGWPVFVTTDAAYHVWHLAFDKILRETEQQTLLPALEDMVLRLVELARAQETELAGTDLAYKDYAAGLDYDLGWVIGCTLHSVEK